MSYAQELIHYNTTPSGNASGVQPTQLGENISNSPNEYVHFNWLEYINFYKDLSFMKSKKQAWDHWVKYGKHENRKYFFLEIDKNIVMESNCDISSPQKNVERTESGQRLNSIDDSRRSLDNKINKKIKKIDKIDKIKNAYEKFDWEYYIQYYNSVSTKNINDKLSAWDNWNKLENKERQYFFVVQPPEIIRYENFDWVTYVTLNKDLANMDRKQLWGHWLNNGSKEDRPFRRINTTRIHRARFGNLFFINMAFHFIAMKNNLKVSYKYYEKFKQLGISFFVGNKTFEEEYFLSDNSFFNIIKNNEKIEKNIVIDPDDFYCQTKDFCLHLQDKFKEIFTENIKKTNIFKERYNNNQDVFIHVRLGDIQNDNSKSNNKEYYDNILSVLNFEKGYISSDTIKSDFCQFLIKKYNLEIIDLDEVKTIMFASTCKNIILSGGTFSWLIGFLSFYSHKIYYPKNKKTWYGDIFAFDDWIQVNID